MNSLLVYCDESVKNGKFYSNFYGGALVVDKDINYIIKELDTVKKSEGIGGELKWVNVSVKTLESYIRFIDKYFDFIKDNKIKIRIMFKQEYYQTIGLSDSQKEQEFYILYYHFLRQAFGFQYCNETDNLIKLKIFFDKLPNKRSKNNEFKDIILRLQDTDIFKLSKLVINSSDITDVDSKKHIILQGMDIILGAMKFRLNEEHRIKPEGSRVRGKKTIAKEKLYKHIRARINEFYPNFNVGISTGMREDLSNRWKDPYRHWNFISSNSIVDESRAKK